MPWHPRQVYASASPAFASPSAIAGEQRNDASSNKAAARAVILIFVIIWFFEGFLARNYKPT